MILPICKEKQKVVFIPGYTPYGGNKEIFTLDEILLLKNMGIDPIIIPRSHGKLSSVTVGKDILQNTINVKLIDGANILAVLRKIITDPKGFFFYVAWSWRWSWSYFEFIKALAVLPKALRVARDLKNTKIDHVHSTNTNTMVIMAFVISQELSIPWSFTLHSWWPSFVKRKKCFELMIESASFCRVISKKACDELKSLIKPELHKKCYPIHIGTKCDQKYSYKTVKNKKYVIATPAVLEQHKGQKVAIEAGKQLVEQGIKNFKWIFFGEGSMREELQNLIEREKLSEFFSLPGMLPNNELIEMYRRGSIDVVALPSIESTGMPEGIPHALIQSMSFGIPAISTNSGGSLELTGDDAGIVVPQSNSKALAEALQELMDNEDRYLELSRNAYKKIEKEFNSDIICIELKTLMMKNNNSFV